ncbi:uncharacterized protein LOC113359944 [Papaver somniferum]|uniref:uncharacterized protein LOC113359944 n=1 Tax=Papaver somniferum TaxID=3469 RepID=UPI000E704B2B|nr:uncharacterized protein LOC113359944 [Papaver somniferum]
MSFFLTDLAGLLIKMGYVTGQRDNWIEEIKWCADSFVGSSIITTIWKLTFNIYVYHIWKERKARLFKQTNLSTDKVCWLIIRDIQLKLASHDIVVDVIPFSRSFFHMWNVTCIFQLKVELRCTWVRPEGDTVMINTDGSLRLTMGCFGVIIRYGLGVCLIAFAGSSMVISVLGHELQGIEAGMLAAIHRGFKRSHFGLDSMAAVTLMNNTDPDPPRNVRYIWRHIVRLRKQLDWIRIDHIYRETNRATDWLDGIYPPSAFEIIDWERLGEEFAGILTDDSSQIVYFQL